MTNQVENFITQYEQELDAQEINANKRILNGFVWFPAAVALVWILTITNVFNVNKNMVTAAFLLSFILFLPAFYLMYRGNLSKDWVKYCLLTLLCIICGIIISILSYHATLLYVFPLLYAIQYREKKIIWFTYFVNMVTIVIASLIGYYYGTYDLNLLLSVIPAAVILLILAVMLQYTVISNTRDALRIAQLTYYKDTDTNTKVFNKNKYEEMITKYYPSVDKLAVIFFDLNNLKKINDGLGHAMGDYVIEKLASIVNSFSNDYRRVYRIGGDEFVMLIENPVEGEAEEIVTTTRSRLNLHNEVGPVAISSAMGFAYGKGSDILEVVKAADEKMYENKKLMKSQL